LQSVYSSKKQFIRTTSQQPVLTKPGMIFLHQGTMLTSASKKTLDFFSCLIRKRQVQGGRWLKNRSLLFVNDCFEDKPNAAIGVFLQGLTNIKQRNQKRLFNTKITSHQQYDSFILNYITYTTKKSFIETRGAGYH